MSSTGGVRAPFPQLVHRSGGSGDLGPRLPDRPSAGGPVDGGDWSFVAMPEADLTKATFTGTRMREADLTRARASGATLRHLDLSGAELHEADLGGADLRGSDLSAVDPRAVELTGAQIDVTQAVVLVTSLGLNVRPDAPE